MQARTGHRVVTRDVERGGQGVANGVQGVTALTRIGTDDRGSGQSLEDVVRYGKTHGIKIETGAVGVVKHLGGTVARPRDSTGRLRLAHVFRALGDGEA